MTAPYDYEALWDKAKLFINLAMDEGDGRTFAEQALWAALALELLAKAALARVSPLLIAVPNEEGVNLLIASGLIGGEARFKSVTAKTLFTRCSRAFKPFNYDEAMRIANARNNYLHGSEPTFTPVPSDAWWPRFWAQAVVLVNALDRTVEELVGSSRVGSVDSHLEKNQSNLEDRLEMLIERARQRRAQEEAGEIRVRVAREPVPNGSPQAGLSYWIEQECPACGKVGMLEGDLVQDLEMRYEQSGPDDFDAWVDVTVAVDHFSCEECRLVLDSYELTSLAGLPDEFVVQGEVEEFYEPDYGND